MLIAMERHYECGWSEALGRTMEHLRFGDRGAPVLAFPTSRGRFFQWEDFGLVDGLADRIEAGSIQLWCVDSVDGESWYANDHPPAERVRRHLAFELYLLDELLPRLPEPPVAVGSSLGAFHAVLTCLRHPDRFRGWVGMSGVYDNSRWLDGYHDQETYLTNPLAFVSGLAEEGYLGPLRAMAPKVIVTGRDDSNVEDSIRLSEALRTRGVDVRLDLWEGWAHDWPYWKEMTRAYLP
jgi:esterase/lipase superfamily enzyme